MKIKRDCSSPFEVKDALECRDETRRDAMQRYAAMRHDATTGIVFYLYSRGFIPTGDLCDFLYVTGNFAARRSSVSAVLADDAPGAYGATEHRSLRNLLSGQSWRTFPAKLDSVATHEQIFLKAKSLGE